MSAVQVQMIFFVVVAAIFAGVSTGTVVKPAYQYVRTHATTTINCQFTTALTDCRVRVRDRSLAIDSELDLGRGSSTPAAQVKDTKGETWLTARYAGSGLANGHCGVELAGLHTGEYIVQCRGRSDSGDWSQDFGLLTCWTNEVLVSSTETPRYIVALRDTDVSVLLTTLEGMEHCAIETPGAGYRSLTPTESPPSDSRYRLHGAGLRSSQCGYTVPKVTEADSGLWLWWGWLRDKLAQKMSVVAIAAPPVDEPQLHVKNASELRPGDTMTATCWTSPSIPPASITWLLGGKVIRSDAWNATLQDDVARTTLPWQPQPARQTLSRLLTSSDHGKRLECRVSHVALSGPLTSSVVLGVSTGPVVQPAYQYIREHATTTIGCQFTTALTNCRVRVWDRSNAIDSELDLGRGSSTPAAKVKDTKGETWLTARYAGSGLTNGHCGVELAGLHSGEYIVQCRGRSDSGDWSQNFGLLTSFESEVMASTTLTPRYVVALWGTDVSVLLSTHEGLETCRIETPAAGTLHLSPGESPPSDRRYRLHGAGPGSGQCGYTVPKVTEADAGLWLWWGWLRAKLPQQMSVVAIAAPPVGEPQLDVTNHSQLHAGDTMTATCSTSPSVPPADITWLLGGEVIRADTWNATLHDDVARTVLPWQPQPTRQTLSHVLTSSDHSMRLECRVSHVALSGSLTSSFVLDVSPGASECGKVDRVKQLLAGGQDADLGQFPWHAGIYRQKGRTYEQQCGGSLVSPRLIISAAHCFYNEAAQAVYDSRLFRVTLGTRIRAWESNVDRSSAQSFEVANITVPEYYTGSYGNFLHDVAVVRLAQEAVMTRTVRLVCLGSSKGFVQAGINAMVAGWGATDQSYSSEKLQGVMLPFVSMVNCRDLLRKLGKLHHLTPDKFCAGLVNRTTSVCPGDSGGGLVVLDSATKRHFLVGIVSVAFKTTFGTADTCQAELFTGFTAVSAHADWLRGTLAAEA